MSHKDSFESWDHVEGVVLKYLINFQ